MAGQDGLQQHPLSGTVIITLIVTVGLAVLAAFWQLSDPRTEIKTLRDDIHNNYLTIREHEEFVRRESADLTRVELENRDQNSRNATKTDLENHEKSDETFQRERSVRIDQSQHQLELRMNLIQRQLDLLINRSLVEPPPTKGVPNK